MTKPDLMAELAAVVRLSERATPGPWKEWRDGAADYAKVEACPDGPNIANTGRLGWDEAIENAQLIAAAVNFLRTHHAELAEAIADARRYRWLRDHQFSFTHDQHERGIASTRWGEWVDIDDAASLDLCIDTVMREGSDHDRRIDAQHNSAREG